MMTNGKGTYVKKTGFDKVTLGGLFVHVITPEFEMEIYSINDEDDFVCYSLKMNNEEIFERDIDVLEYDKYLKIAKSLVEELKLVELYKEIEKKELNSSS